MRLLYHDFIFMGCIFTLFLYLSLSIALSGSTQRVNAWVVYAFTISVDKHFDACKRVEPVHEYSGTSEIRTPWDLAKVYLFRRCP